MYAQIIDKRSQLMKLFDIFDDALANWHTLTERVKTHVRD